MGASSLMLCVFFIMSIFFLSRSVSLRENFRGRKNLLYLSSFLSFHSGSVPIYAELSFVCCAGCLLSAL